MGSSLDVSNISNVITSLRYLQIDYYTIITFFGDIAEKCCT